MGQAISDIKCPCSKCKQTLKREEILLAIGNRIEKYDNICLQNALRKMPDFKHCPKPDCGFGGLVDLNSSFTICSECKFKFCHFCSSEFHQGYNCKQYFIMKIMNGNDLEAKSQIVIQVTSKRCVQTARCLFKRAEVAHTCNVLIVSLISVGLAWKNILRVISEIDIRNLLQIDPL
jgi:hypothetical protein